MDDEKLRRKLLLFLDFFILNFSFFFFLIFSLFLIFSFCDEEKRDEKKCYIVVGRGWWLIGTCGPVCLC